MKKSILIITIIFVSNLKLFADDRKSLLKDLNNFYALMSVEKMDLSIHYNLYDKIVNGAPYQTSSVSMKFDKTNKYITNEHYTLYSNSIFNLIIYKKNKVAILSKSKSIKEWSKSLASLMPDSVLFQQLNHVKLISDTAGIKTYHIDFVEDSGYKKWILVFDKRRQIIKRSTFYYKKSVINDMEKIGRINEKDKKVEPILDIEYTINDLEVAGNFFEAPNVLVKEKKEFKLTKQYQGYRFYNQFNKTN